MERLCTNGQVKKNVGLDITSILNEFIEDKDDIKEEGTFIGKVLDNNDPEKLGRCKILVYTVFFRDIMR